MQTAAPFLQWDADPYAVNLEREDRVGARRLHDARTAIRTRSRSIPTVPPAAGSTPNINYVRNSVKATVDAYDGTVHFYVVDPSDPIIRTYEKAFPDLFDQVDDDAGGPARSLALPRGHLQDADRAVHAVPHDRSAAVLPEGRAVGHRAEPRRAGTAAAPAVTAAPVGGDNGGRNSTLSGSGNPINPLYLMMQLPGRERSGVRARATVRPDQQSEPTLVVHGRAQRRRQLREVGRCTRRPINRTRSHPRAPRRSSRPTRRSARSSRCSTSAAPRCCAAIRSSYRSTARSSTCARSTWRARATRRCPRYNYVAVTYGERAVLDDKGVTDAVSHLLNGTTRRARERPSASTDNGGTPTTTTTTTPGSTTNTTTPVTAPANATVAQLLAQANAAVRRGEPGARRAGPRDLRRRSTSRPQALVDAGRTRWLGHDRRRRPTPTSTTTRAEHVHDEAQIGRNHHHRRATRNPRAGDPGAGRDCRGVRGLLLSR